MSLSKFFTPSIMEEVYSEAYYTIKRIVDNRGDLMKEMQKMFVARSRRKTFPDITEYANVNLRTYFKNVLELSPDQAGLRFLQSKMYPQPRDKYFDSLIVPYIPKEYYENTSSFDSGAEQMSTSQGEVEELYMNIWIERTETLLGYNKSKFASKRLNYDRVIRVCFETREIIRRVFNLEHAQNNLKLLMIDGIFLKLTAINHILLREIHMVIDRRPILTDPIKKKEAYQHYAFIVMALIVYQPLLPVISAIRFENREGIIAAQRAGHARRDDLFVHTLPDGSSVTNTPVVTTSATPSSSTTVVENDVRQFV